MGDGAARLLHVYGLRLGVDRLLGTVAVLRLRGVLRLRLLRRGDTSNGRYCFSPCVKINNCKQSVHTPTHANSSPARQVPGTEAVAVGTGAAAAAGTGAEDCIPVRTGEAHAAGTAAAGSAPGTYTAKDQTRLTDRLRRSRERMG